MWEKLAAKERPENKVVHVKNIPQFKLIAEHFNCYLECEEFDIQDDWTSITFKPQGIRLVK
jgi:hypothetical protein